MEKNAQYYRVVHFGAFDLAQLLKKIKEKKLYYAAKMVYRLRPMHKINEDEIGLIYRLFQAQTLIDAFDKGEVPLDENGKIKINAESAEKVAAKLNGNFSGKFHS